MPGMPVRRARREAARVEAEAYQAIDDLSAVLMGEPPAKPKRQHYPSTAHLSAVPTGHKRCSKCGEIKPLEEFHRSKHNWKGDGRRSSCKACRWKPPPPEYDGRFDDLLADRIANDDEEAQEADREPRTKPKPRRRPDDEEEIAASADLKSKSPPPIPNYAPVPKPRAAQPEPQPEPERRWWPKPVPVSNSAPPAYLREGVVQRFSDMTWAEQQEELRYPTIHDAGSTMPRYLREALREGRL